MEGLAPQSEEKHVHLVTGTDQEEAGATTGATDGGLRVSRRYATAGVDPFQQVEWEVRSATITGEGGERIFEQKNVEVPGAWSQLATNVVVSKYFRGPVDSRNRESSVRQLIGRVTNTITRWGVEGGYFASPADASAFHDELVYMLLHQMMSFNSPVWFNVGVDPQPQCSACFINSVHDNMDSILSLAATEARLFKGGSGTGSNLSTIRGSKEPLSGGGTASGPVSFMRGYDAFAGVIKSGGKTRRAAKMVILDIDHPDIKDFIECKAQEERKAWALIEAGYDGSFNVPGGAYDSIAFQNANHSIRVTDAFMKALQNGQAWYTRAVTDGHVMDRYKADELWDAACEAAWVCGDPGIQFDTTINDWHTCPNSGRIRASNPCSEFMFLDDSACNLASLNLMKFRDAGGEFDADSFVHACEVTILAQEIIVGASSYPTRAIRENSLKFRPLGLGYANLGALLMARGVPYDSAAGRAIAAAVTALMTGAAYRQSAKIAGLLGPFEAFPDNREPMLEVMHKHEAALDRIDARFVPGELLEATRDVWRDTVALGEAHGYRNAQATVLAPTGTIGFMMDCDTTGIEPDIALVKYKKLVGGGVMKLVNHTVPEALERLGYDEGDRAAILDHVEKNETIEKAPGIRAEHVPVFDCAFRPLNGTRSIHYMGHLRMMGAVQPFISGAISKTVNLPPEATPADVGECYLQAWKLGVKAVAVYRDGSKRTQPVTTSKTAKQVEEKREPSMIRRKLPVERAAITHKFSIAGHEGYITTGMYEDGSLGEIFLVMSKEGSVVSGLMDVFATAVSLALQYGVPLQVLVDKFTHVRFEPSGFTNNPDIPIAKSIVDYIFRWLELKFLKPTADTSGDAEHAVEVSAGRGPSRPEVKPASQSSRIEDTEHRVFVLQADAPPCMECGMIMVRNGSCYKCHNCGSTSGCS